MTPQTAAGRALLQNVMRSRRARLLGAESWVAEIVAVEIEAAAKCYELGEKAIRSLVESSGELALATTTEPTEVAPSIDVTEPFDASRMTHAWAILVAETNPNRWEPDRYNAAAFVRALLDKYDWLATATLADLAPGRRPSRSQGRL